MCSIDCPYLLALNVTLRHFDNGYWADASWAKDIEKHLAYLPELTLFCPVQRRPPDRGWRRIESKGLRIVGFGEPSSSWTFLARLPLLLPRLWREVGRATIVHSGVAGWPLPLGWFAAPFAKMRGKQLALIVESAFWRLPVTDTAGILTRFKARVWERMARRCMAMADYAAYTQPEYQRSLPALNAGGGTIAQASWVDVVDCIDDGAADASWAAKADERPRFLYAARLIREKGTQVLIDMLAALGDRDAALAIDIIGEGPEHAALAAAAAAPWGRRNVRLLDPQPYGPAFLQLVRHYHGLIVPGLTDEQPRIVYDGCSQAVPSIGSDSAGLRACILDGLTGALVPPGDAAALAEALVASTPETLREWGLHGLARVRGLTHDALHRERCRDLRAMLDRAGLDPDRARFTSSADARGASRSDDRASAFRITRHPQ